MGPGIIDHTLAAILHQVFEELQRLHRVSILQARRISGTHLIDLSPLACLLLHETSVNGGHDLVKGLATWHERVNSYDGMQRAHKLKVLRSTS